MFIQKIKISTNIPNIDDYNVYLTDNNTEKTIRLGFDIKTLNEITVYRQFSTNNFVTLTFEGYGGKSVEYCFSLGDEEQYKSKVHLKIMESKICPEIYVDGAEVEPEVSYHDCYYYLDSGLLKKS